MTRLRITVVLVSLLAAACQRGSHIHVSPAGDDSADGSRAKPFATLERARDAARGAKKKPVTVWIHGGTYHLDNPFELTAHDSGTKDSPVVFRAADGETPVLTGARRLTSADFGAIAEPATLARIAPSARGKVMALDFSRTPVKNSKPFPDVFTDFGGIADLYLNGERMTLARFPNDGWMTFKSVIHTAGGPQGDWQDTSNIQRVPRGSTGGIFEYRGEFADKHATWSKQLDRGVWLRGYWRVAWENSALRVHAIDPESRTATFAKPIHNGIGNKYNRPKGNGREAYQLINLLEEIDMPGEWCMDFKDRRIYFWPPASPENADIRLADNDEPVIRVRDGAHIVIRGLTVDTNLGNGIEVLGGNDVLIAGCVVRNVNRDAIVLDGGFRHEARSNDLYQLGAGGVWLRGGDDTVTPRVPAGHRVVNNHIHHFARIQPVYAAGVNSGFTGGGGGGHHTAVGMYVANNLIHDTPHVGVLCGSMDSVFEFNEVSRYCLVSNDMGAFYSYDYRKRNFGNLTFRHNLIHSSPLGDGIYFDHDHPDMKVIGNIIALGSTGTRGTACLFKQGDMVKDGLPQDFDCEGNIAVDCKVGYEFVSILPHRGTIAGNVAVDCRKPFVWREVKNGKSVSCDDYSTGPNKVHPADPRLANLAASGFDLTKSSAAFRDLPQFKSIPVERIGLFTDEFRKTLPSPAEKGRTVSPSDLRGLGYDIMDRP